VASSSGSRRSVTAPQRHRAARDARYVEQVIDETHYLAHLALDHLALAHRAIGVSESHAIDALREPSTNA
jgi:hypothetical protein